MRTLASNLRPPQLRHSEPVIARARDALTARSHFQRSDVPGGSLDFEHARSVASKEELRCLLVQTKLIQSFERLDGFDHRIIRTDNTFLRP